MTFAIPSCVTKAMNAIISAFDENRIASDADRAEDVFVNIYSRFNYSYYHVNDERDEIRDRAEREFSEVASDLYYFIEIITANTHNQFTQDDRNAFCEAHQKLREILANYDCDTVARCIDANY
jgi:hypothetical protein